MILLTVVSFIQMAKFCFRLATLQKLRESHRDEMRLKLAEAHQAQQLLAQQISLLHTEAADLRQTRRTKLHKASMNVNHLLDCQRYQAVLRAQLATMNQQSEILAAEVEKRRQTLVQADQQVRVLDKLHQRQLDAHRRQELRAEAKVLDEIASRPREVNL